jgi:dephospho-CoA kinase
MIIGISGKAGSGKDTAAKMLEVLYANPDISYEDFANRRYKNFADIQVVHFADILKETVQALFGIGEWETNTQEGKKTTISWIGKTVRELLQGVGQGLRDAIDPNLWVKALFANVEGWSNYIIADVRYPNELEAIKERGGILLRIDRNGAGAGNHSSETALDDYREWDFHIGNNGSMEDLFEAMKIFTKNYPID